jgi:hypothetical protein
MMVHPDWNLSKKCIYRSIVRRRRITDLLKMLIHQNIWRTALFRRPMLVEHIKFLESEAKSRYLAGLLIVIHYF